MNQNHSGFIKKLSGNIYTLERQKYSCWKPKLVPEVNYEIFKTGFAGFTGFDMRPVGLRGRG
jgi:hypothetical protein